MAEDPQGAGEGMPQDRVAMRRSRCRQGEGVGGYTVDTRGLVNAMGGGSQPSSQQVPGRTPHETLHYATGDDLEAFLSMAAKLLHCQEAGSSEEIRELVCQLTDTRVVCEPLSPCLPPQSSALANLEAWDCTSHMVHIRSLLQLVHRISLLALTHVYHGGNRTHHLGYQALCAARGAIARASSIIIYTSGDSDVRASRLVCDIIIVDVQGTATSLAETILRAGLAHPMPSAPATYLSAYAKAESAAATPCPVLLPHTSPLTPRRRARQQVCFQSSHQSWQSCRRCTQTG